jgi:hypothetical protein
MWLKIDIFTMDFQRTHIIKISWWYKKRDDNNLLDALKKHSWCEILKLWKFKVCTFENLKNFKSSRVFCHIYMGYNVHDVYF